MSSGPTGGDGARLRLALAGGGTGGHVLPGLHLLGHASVRAELGDLLWLGTGRRAELEALEELGPLVHPCPFERAVLPLEPRGGGAPSRPWLAARTLPAVVRARRALRAHRSQVLLGLGGFVCLPAVLAAASLGLRVALLEINAVRGTATRFLGPLADRVFHAWPDSVPEGDAGRGRHVVTGPPLGPRFAGGGPRSAGGGPRFAGGEPDAAERSAARAQLGFAPERPLLLVLGGSQGAGALNRFVREQADALQREGLQILHQVGPGKSAEAAAARAGYRAVEFERDVALALTAATLVLCRGGALTLAEVAALQVPALVVPYPHHRDRHQAANARQLGGGALTIDERELGPATAAEIARLGSARGAASRQAMARALAGAVPLDGASRIAQALARLARAPAAPTSPNGGQLRVAT